MLAFTGGLTRAPCALLLWLTFAGLVPVGFAQQINPYAEMRKSMKPQYRVGWDLSFAFGMAHRSGADPLLKVEIGTGESHADAEAAAQSVPRNFKFQREQGRIPFILIEADMRPRFRRDLVPVMRVGELGLFTDAGVSAEMRRAVAASVRQVAAGFPGGHLSEGGVPATLGGEADLVRLLEQHDRERASANARTQADNVARLSVDDRQRNTGYAFSRSLERELGRRPVVSHAARASSPPWNVDVDFRSFRRMVKEFAPKGNLVFVYGPATAPKVSLEGLLPLARIGAWGAWGSSEAPAADLATLAAAALAAVQDEEFREDAFLMGIVDFGGPDELGRLVASVPDIPLPAPAASSANPAPAKSAAAATTAPRVVDAHGPRLPAPPLARGGTGQGAGRNPPAIRPNTGPQGWLPVSDEEKARQAKDRADFKERMATKQRKIEDLKKQRSREDAERLANNLKTFQAWADQKKAEVAARDQRMIEKLRAAESRSDAVTAVIESINGLPHIVLVNNTDCALYVEYSYTGTIDGQPLPWAGEGWTILPSGLPPEKRELTAFSGEDTRRKPWLAQIVKIRWWAREQDNRWRN